MKYNKYVFILKYIYSFIFRYEGKKINKGTRVNRVRGKNAYNNQGIVPNRTQTRKRFEEYYLRSFNNTQVGVTNFKNTVKPLVMSPPFV